MHWSKLEGYFTGLKQAASSRASGDPVSARAYTHAAETALARALNEATWYERSLLGELRSQMEDLDSAGLVRFSLGYRHATSGESAEDSDMHYLNGYIKGHHWWRNAR